MTLEQLQPDELRELKEHYYNDKHPEGVSYGELAAIDDLVTFEELETEYSGIDFVPDDFFCNSNPEARKREQVQRICAKIHAMSPDELRDFLDFVKEKQPDIYAAVFEEYDK